jgi:hypothetical protein
MEERLDWLTKQKVETTSNDSPSMGAASGSNREAAPIGGGRSLSRAGGGDPTAVGQAQEVGNLQVTARYSQLDLDSRVFTAGLADPNRWTNHAKLVDVGANCFLNQFLKVYFDWEHAFFDRPVFSSSGRFRKSNDLFWVRTQLFF